MRNIGIDQMENEGGVEEYGWKQVGGTESRHSGDCWEFSPDCQPSHLDGRKNTYNDIHAELSLLAR